MQINLPTHRQQAHVPAQILPEAIQKTPQGGQQATRVANIMHQAQNLNIHNDLNGVRRERQENSHDVSRHQNPIVRPHPNLNMTSTFNQQYMQHAPTG